MSTSSETIFGQDKNMVIAVASAIIFTLAVGMLVVFANQGATKGWDGNTVLATVFSSMIALIFVSVAVTYGFLKGKEAGSQALSDIKDIRARDKERSEKLAKEIELARKKVTSEEMKKNQTAEDAKKLAALKDIENQMRKKEIEARVIAEIEKEKQALAVTKKIAPQESFELKKPAAAPQAAAAVVTTKVTIPQQNVVAATVKK